MGADFELQRTFRPAVQKAALHAIISFCPGENLTDGKLTSIAKDYLEKVGITNTQYVITKHTDRDHPHVHIMANVVDNEGKSINTSWIGLRSRRVLHELATVYAVKVPASKDLSLTHFDRLNKRDANRYFIYQSVMAALRSSRDFQQLKENLRTYGIECLYRQEDHERQRGIIFKVGEYRYKGSAVDREFSLPRLTKVLGENTLSPTDQFDNLFRDRGTDKPVADKNRLRSVEEEQQVNAIASVRPEIRPLEKRPGQKIPQMRLH
jgi:hypothetical protein